MTIPSRPAPAPPGSRAQNAAAGANASLEQLRLQLQQQQQQTQNFAIKLPPPPKPGHNVSVHNGFQLQQQQQMSRRPQSTPANNISNNNFLSNDSTNNTSITRKFPQARYTPATNWDDSPFGAAITNNGNNGFNKKVAPPRPPPPKVQINGRKMTAPGPPATTNSNGGGGGGGLLTNIFHRNKKSNSSTTSTTSITNVAANKAATQNRIYGLSSGISASSTTNYNSITNTSTNANYNWNAAWDSVSSTTTSTTNNRYGTTITSTNSCSSTVQEAQLISFDSPPSSPTFTQKSNSDCVSVDSFSSDSNFSSPNNGSVSQPESGFEDDFHNTRSRPATTSPLDPWENVDAFGSNGFGTNSDAIYGTNIGTAPVRNLTGIKTNGTTANNIDNPLCNGKSLLPPAQSLAMPTIIKPKIAQKPKAPKPPLLAKPNYNLDLRAVENLASTPPSPPMPKSAPPPPPPAAALTETSGVNGASKGVSILDVISGKVDAMALSAGSSGYVEETVAPYAIALYDFEGVEEDDLSFRINEKIYLIEQVSETWYRGRTRAGCVGLFPENYVEIKVPLQDLSAAASTQQTAAATNNAALPTALCLYDFPGECEGDLALKENDIVTILYKINEDWLYGEIAGRQGQFPAVFLEHVPDQLPMP